MCKYTRKQVTGAASSSGERTDGLARQDPVDDCRRHHRGLGLEGSRLEKDGVGNDDTHRAKGVQLRASRPLRGRHVGGSRLRPAWARATARRAARRRLDQAAGARRNLHFHDQRQAPCRSAAREQQGSRRPRAWQSPSAPFGETCHVTAAVGWVPVERRTAECGIAEVAGALQEPLGAVRSD